MPRRRPKPPGKKLLTPRQVALARRVWMAGGTRDEVARAIGVTVDVLQARLADQLKTLPRRGRGGNLRRPTADPSPEEIWGKLTKEAQARWTDDERERAWVGSSDRRPAGY